jgi:sugar (pentulose or hexulose) kinase
MENCIIAIDLGTTNFKFCLYDEALSQIAAYTIPVTYIESRDFVEFDAERYWQDCKSGIAGVIQKAGIRADSVGVISLTGQAESIVLLDTNDRPLCNAISWQDSRSTEECRILSQSFEAPLLYETTGLPQLTPTWPATKLLWLKRLKPELYTKIARILLIKDFITLKLSGSFATEYSVFSFSCLFNQAEKKVWKEMCDRIGIHDGMLPDLLEPGTIVGTVRKNLAEELSLSRSTKICAGVLDHIAGMIGTGNISRGKVNETTGTVQALAVQADSFLSDRRNIEYHYGAMKDTYVQLLVCESGGICLQWFRDTFLPGSSFQSIDESVEGVIRRDPELLFLPYISGLNSPEYDASAKGVFYGINIKHGIADFSRAVMEASGFLLRKNIDFLEENGQRIHEINSIGGAAYSDIWCRMKADITGREVVTFSNKESTNLGAAIMGAVASGYYANLRDAVDACVRTEKIYSPKKDSVYEDMYGRFIDLYDRLFSPQKEESCRSK